MRTTLTVGVFTPSVLLSVARRIGRLDEYGLDVTSVPVPSSPAQFRALLADDLHVALTSPDNVLAYRFSPTNPLGATSDVAILSAVDRGMGLALYGRPGLRDARELKGALVGVDVPSSGFALAMYALCDALGVSRDSYAITALGSTPKRLKALLAGDCDATMLGAGNELLAEEAGCVALARVTDVCENYVGSVLAIAGTKHAGPAGELARALRDTAAEIRDGQLDQLVTAVAVTELNLAGTLGLRYLERLKSPTEGLIVSDAVDATALHTIIDLRRRYLPEPRDGGGDVLDAALDPDSGLILR